MENGGNVSKAMRDAGYSHNTAHTPQKLTESEAWQVLMGKSLSDVALAEKHEALLSSHRLDHMTFPLGPIEDEDDDDIAISMSMRQRTSRILFSRVSRFSIFTLPTNGPF